MAGSPSLVSRIAVTVVIFLLASFVAWRLWVYYLEAPWTRDGKIRADFISVAPDVSGLVSQVLVHENDQVKKGDILFRIDPDRFKIAILLARARVSGAMAVMDEAGRNARRYHQLMVNGDATREVARNMEARFEKSRSDYQEAMARLSIAILDQVIEDEKEHYRELGSLLRGHYQAPAGAPKIEAKAVLEELLAKRNNGRKQPGAWIGDAIYGVNDGLGAIFGIVSGVSGATLGDPAQTSHYVLLAGISGMVASALSMGSGAYLAAKSEREIYHAEVAREREAIAMNGPEARELLSLYYQVKGLPEADAHHMVNHIASDSEQLLRALASERLGSSEEALSNPMVSATSGALSTAVGAIIPVIPFFFLNGIPAVIVAAIVSLLAHFAVGAAKSLITVRSWWSSGLEMTIVGAVEGAVTYGIGILLGKGIM